MKDDTWKAFYRLLKRLDLPRPTVPCPVGAGTVAIGWPDLRVGLVMQGDPRPDRFDNDDWHIFELPTADVDRFIDTLDAVVVEIDLRRSRESSPATTSGAEQILLAAMLRAGLPIPERDRRFYFADGSLATIPDFCWPDARLAVELDGWWYHGGRELAHDIRAAAAKSRRRKTQVMRAEREKATRDAAKRRLLASLGWRVVVVTDAELGGDPDAIAAQIREIYDACLGLPTAASGTVLM